MDRPQPPRGNQQPGCRQGIDRSGRNPAGTADSGPGGLSVLAAQAEASRAAAETERDTAVEQARQDAATRITAADLRARAERAEQQADAYRDELARLRAEGSHLAGAIAGKTPRRAAQATQP